jgi:AcrR family transcriptional regulator
MPIMIRRLSKSRPFGHNFGTRMASLSTPRSRPGRPGGRRDSNRKQRLAELERAALSLYLARGLDAVAVEDLAAEAGLAKAGFYRYFASQEALVAALIAPLARAFARAMTACERALAAAPDTAALPPIYLSLATELWSAMAPRRATVRLYLQECRMPPVGARQPIARLAGEIERRAVRITAVARERALIRDLEPRVVALVVVGAVERLLHGALAGRKLGDPAEVARVIVTTVVDGIRADRR